MELEPGEHGRQRIPFEMRQAWRDWLEANHTRRHGLWPALETPGARAGWDASPPSAQRSYLTLLVLAKRAQTRATRVTDIAALAARGERPGAPSRTARA